MIRPCRIEEADEICAIVNDAAEAYKGVIPEDRWQEPHMPKGKLLKEWESGVQFWGYEEEGTLNGIMGIQYVQDVALIRHAYVKTALRKKGIGTKLLKFLCKQTNRPILVGTWGSAAWAIRFYEKNGFQLIESRKEKDALLKRYWDLPQRQVETSVVLSLKNRVPPTHETGSLAF